MGKNKYDFKEFRKERQMATSLCLLINGIIQYYNNLIMNFCNKIVEVLEVTN